MADYEKINVVLNDNRTPPRSKLAILLLTNGFSLTETINFSADKIPTLKEMENGEEYFLEYVKTPGTMERIAKSNLLFPGTDSSPMQADSFLRFLRRACRTNGFQLHQLQIEGLVSNPITGISIDGKIKDAEKMSFDEVMEFILKRK